MSATRSARAACRAIVSASGFLKMSKIPISACHEVAERPAQHLRMFTGLFGLLRQPREPVRWIDAFGVEHDAVHHHGDIRLQPAAVDFEAISFLSQLDQNPLGLRAARKKTAAFVDRHQLRQGFFESERKSPQIAFGIGLETPQPCGLHVEINILRHRCTAAALTPCIPCTSRSRIAVTLASRSPSPAATSRSISITSCMVLIASSATCASTSMLRWSPPRLRAALVAASCAPFEAKIVI